jgi:hypothetical protein
VRRFPKSFPHCGFAFFLGGCGTVFEQGLGLFCTPEDAALLDEVVSIAYQERRRPSKRGQAF